ncbi:LysR family transcriptional regulator [Pigmentiphaga litoralis]|uniref:LysR family transcriptional regulator n=1 Tax=Pigmentiphaga litoralis TaxID=516702 RepID=UPI003B4339A7
MEIYQLRSFVTVARLGNLTRAAEALHVTQPAVTAQIKALEEELGVTLFDRRPGRIVLTRTGEMLVPDADHILAGIGGLLSKARALQGSVTGTFLIGTLGDPDALRLGSLLSAMVRAMPVLDIKTRQGHSEALRELVATGALRAAFYIGPNTPRDVLALPLQTIHYRVVGPPSFKDRLLHAGWRELADMPWIGCSPQHHAQVLLRDMFARQGLSPNVAIDMDEFASPHSLVRAGVGLALLREDIAVPAGARDEMAIWPHARASALLSFIHGTTTANDPATVETLALLRSVWRLGS